jgi:hypothetical protein
MVKRSFAALLSLISMLVGFACTSTQSVDSSRSEKPATEACFDVNVVRTFSPLDMRFVYVRVRSDEHYLLTLDTIYPDLPFATGIRIAGSFNRVCSTSEAELTYASSTGPKTCRILSVEAVASKEAAEKLAKERSKPTPKEKD